MTPARSTAVRRLAGGVLLILLLMWTGICAWSWWTGASPLAENAYYAVRDRIQPDGYSINGPLRRDLPWTGLHLTLVGFPWLLGWWLVMVRARAGGGRGTGPGQD